jgi:hypothetical protein
MPQLIFLSQNLWPWHLPGAIRDQILTQGQRPLASKAALYLLYQAIHLALHQRIVMVFKMACDGGTLFIC